MVGKDFVMGKEVGIGLLKEAVDHFKLDRLRCWGRFFGNWYIGIAHAKKAVVKQ